MGRRALAVLLIILAITASVIAPRVHRPLTQSNMFFFLFPMELLGVLLGGVVAAGYLLGHPDHARGTLGTGLYILLVAAAVGVVFPLWLPTDDAILGSALLAGLLAAVGAGLSLGSAAALAGRFPAGAYAIGLPSAALAFLLVTAGGVVAPLAAYRFPLLITVLVAVGVLGLVWRQRTLLPLPVALAAAGTAVTVVVLVARGPDDWASASTTIKLYSLPIVVLALGVGLAILDAIPP